jgi:heterodisulfide reductase subunit A
MSRIGVFVCHCGENIGATVDCQEVAARCKQMPGVVHSEDYNYMCSDPGQSLIKQAIKEKGLDGVVVAACSPRMHEPTFRRAVSEAGLNPYLCEMANLREHCSWVHAEADSTTDKAADLVHLQVEKVKRNKPLQPIQVPITKTALVIGGGVAGIQAALDIADSGHKVILLERAPSLGGHMAQLSETFPTLDCSQCILTPKMVEAARHPNIDLMIYVPFPQAVPNTPVIDVQNCSHFRKKKCDRCVKACPTDAIRFEQQDELITVDVGAIVLATGFKIMRSDQFPEYGYGAYPDIIDGLQFERLASASGPTQGVIKRPSDGKEPETIVFLACAGSRDAAKGIKYCSKICCMYTAKHAMLYKHKAPHGKAYVFYMDIRAAGKNYDEFVRRAIGEDGVKYIRGRVSRIYEEDGQLIVKGADTLLGGRPVEIKADMVVLATAVQPNDGQTDLARKIHVGCDEYGFFAEAHPKLRPVETNTAGIYLAGACQSPRDIPETVAQAGGAAAKVVALFSRDRLAREPLVAEVNRRPASLYSDCVGCFLCETACPYQAIGQEMVTDRDGKVYKTMAKINPGLCQGCGTCVATCRTKAIDLHGYSNEQIYAEIMSL